MITSTTAHDEEILHIKWWKQFSQHSAQYPTAKNLDVPFSWILKNAVEQSECVNIDYSVLGGTPRISNTRIPVYMVLQAIEHHGTLEGALKAYPQLDIDEVKDAVLFAAAVLECNVDGD